MIRAAFILSPEAFAAVYTEPVLARLKRHVAIQAIVTPSRNWRQYRAELRDVDVVFGGWGGVVMDEEFLSALPKLKAVFYGGGTVRYFVTEAFWSRGIRLTSANAINAIPVCEYTVSAILLGLKRFWHYARLTREQRTFPGERPVPGVYNATIGIVSLGTIGRLVRQKLRGHEVHVLVYDPYLTEEEAAAEKVKKVGLDELFSTSDVVSLHTPLLPETVRLIRGPHLALMKANALFINTARGEIVDEPEMIAVLQQRPDLQALLDVTAPEPPPQNSPLYTLPIVALTPHIAGSLGPECARMGHAMADELERYLEGDPLRWEISPERAMNMT